MNRIIFWLAYAPLWLLTWLPLRALFVLSDFIYLIVYRLVGYRKAVVRENLRKSFPEKPAQELLKIEKDFYRHLCDSFMEWVYPLHRNAEEMEKYYHFVNPQLINQLYAKGKGVVGVLGHYGNWEYLSLLPKKIDHKVWAIYKPLNNKNFDKLITHLRSKYGVNMTPNTESIRRLISEAAAGECTMTYFLADQSPMRQEIKYRTTFLNQDAPVFLGPEMIATKLDMAVVFIDIRKLRRGRYEVEFSLLTETPKLCKPHEITEMHVRALEAAIVRDPAWWLWSHRRWKHGNV